jgi:hypothetical protein
MAKLQEEIIVIKVSTLVPDNSNITVVMDDEKIAALEQIVQEFAGSSRTLVEIERA